MTDDHGFGAPGELKVGIISCSGEDLCEGTISRLATRKVIEDLRRGVTVTLCFPLFLAGDEGERGFARRFPTIAVDGCPKCCAQRGIAAHSGPVSASIVVSELVEQAGQSLSGRRSCRHLQADDMAAVDLVAGVIAQEVDVLLASKQPR